MKTNTYLMTQKQILDLKSSEHSVELQNAFIRSAEGVLRGKTFKTDKAILKTCHTIYVSA